MKYLVQPLAALALASAGSMVNAGVLLESSCKVGLAECESVHLEGPSGVIERTRTEATDPNAWGRATTAVRGDYGDLGARVSLAFETRKFEEFGQVFVGVQQGTATATATFSDSFVVQSASFAAGTKVELLVHGTVHGQIKQPERLYSPRVLGNASLVASWTFETSSLYGDGMVQTQMLCSSRYAYNCDEGSGTLGDYAFAVVTRVGETVSFSSSLEAYIMGSSLWSYEGDSYSGTAYADSLNSLKMFAEAKTAGVTLLSGSGHSYVAAVPEPATWGMFLFGVAGVLVARGRRSGAVQL